MTRQMIYITYFLSLSYRMYFTPCKCDNASDQKAYLDKSNEYRATCSAPPFVWDEDLAEQAQNWAETMSSQHRMYHSGKAGENLYMESSTAGPSSTTPADCVKAWYVEWEDYDFNNPGFSEATGHFTQLVWISSTHVGCGWSHTNESNSYATYVACNYDPAGNVQGQYPQNVKKPKSTSSY